MAKQTIYKYTRIGDDGDTYIQYSVDKKGFLDQQKQDIEQGFSIEDDTIEKITFDDLESLCIALSD